MILPPSATAPQNIRRIPKQKSRVPIVMPFLSFILDWPLRLLSSDKKETAFTGGFVECAAYPFPDLVLERLPPNVNLILLFVLVLLASGMSYRSLSNAVAFYASGIQHQLIYVLSSFIYRIMNASIYQLDFTFFMYFCSCPAVSILFCRNYSAPQTRDAVHPSLRGGQRRCYKK